MNRWDPFSYVPTPKKPPPKRGIKMKKSGTTWWGQRWVEALERMSLGYSSRLARGRTYARAGRTHDLVVGDGEVTAKVTGSGARPYRVTIRVARLADAVWAEAIAAMAAKAQFSAELLAGQMPQEIDAAFEPAGASLFPVREADLTTECTCPDWANPCKHVAATHYVLGEAFDRDPFLLFELRGRSRSQVLDALRAARVADGGAAGEPGDDEDEATAPVATVTLRRMKAADWDGPLESLPPLRLSFETPPTTAGVLRQLGAPSGWSSDTSPADALGPMIRTAAERARTLAMAEPPDEDAPRRRAAGERAASERTGTRKAAAKKKPAKKKPATTKPAKKKPAKKKPATTKPAKKRPAKKAAGSKKRTTRS